MKLLAISLLTIQAVSLGLIHTQAQDSLFNIPDNANQELPPGVPRIVETNGQVLFIDSRFTTSAFQEEGLRLVIREANKVVTDLHLSEAVPITESNLTHAFIGPFGFTYKTGKLGNITTANFSYGVEQGYKFSDLSIANYDQRSVDYYAKYHLPVSEIDTNAAYQLATQWLSAAHMDVNGLTRDCNLSVALTSDLNCWEKPRGKFTPVYFISWTPKVKPKGPSGSTAYVELFLPTKTLLQMCVHDSKYILRPPVGFTNLASLFPGKAAITTNQLVPIKEMSAPPAISPPWLQHPPRQ